MFMGSSIHFRFAMILIIMKSKQSHLNNLSLFLVKGSVRPIVYTYFYQPSLCIFLLGKYFLFLIDINQNTLN